MHRIKEVLRLTAAGLSQRQIARSLHLSHGVMAKYQVVNQNERHDLLEVIEDRHALRSTLITSQLPIAHWHEYLGEPTVADALLDRLLHNAYKLELKGESMRKREKPDDRPKSG